MKRGRSIKSGRGTEKPIKYEDFVVDSPFVRPWMLHYLSNDPRARDISVLLIGSLLSGALAGVVSFFTSSELVVVGIGLGGSGVFLYDMLWRTMYASRKYRKAKRDGGT